jgi:hypothetical protein
MAHPSPKRNWNLESRIGRITNKIINSPTGNQSLLPDVHLTGAYTVKKGEYI